MLAARHVTLVCGPPCAGKSTWVQQHAHPDDTIVCFDQYARAAGSTRTHDHAPAHRRAAALAYRQALAELTHHDGTAWVIRCAPTAQERTLLAQLIRADYTHIVLPPMATALERATRDGRAPRTHSAIRSWYRRHQAEDSGSTDSRPVTSRTW